MKFFCVISVMVSVGLSGSTLAASLDKNVYSPMKGVVCDKKSSLCADEYGLSIRATQHFLGNKAADVANRKLSGLSDTSVFTLSNGLHCKAKLKQCYIDKHSGTVDIKTTNALFGSNNTKMQSANTSVQRVNVDTEALYGKFANFLCGNELDKESCLNGHLIDIDNKQINKNTLSVNKSLLMSKFKKACATMTDDPACSENLFNSVKK